MKMNFETTLRK